MGGYGFAAFVSLGLHTILLVFVILGWSTKADKTVAEKPRFVMAELIELKPRETLPAVAKPVKPPETKPVVKKEDETLKKQQEAERKKQQEQKKAEEERIKAEQERKNQLAKKQAEEKQKAEAAKKQAEEEKRQQEELKKQQEAERKQVLEEELEKERQLELERELAAEQKRLEAQAQAAEDEVVAQSYKSLITNKLRQLWSRPPSSRNGMVVTVKMRLVPTGVVVGQEVVASSGNSAFDRSALRAVEKAASFPELKNLPSRIFERHFREVIIDFSPEDLRQ